MTVPSTARSGGRVADVRARGGGGQPGGDDGAVQADPRGYEPYNMDYILQTTTLITFDCGATRYLGIKCP